jgi:acid phosphatase
VTTWLFSLCLADISFLVVGDWGTHLDPKTPAGSQKAVAESMKKVAANHKVDFVISVGDNFYEHGVQNTTDPLWKADFEDMYNAPSLNVPWYILLGNHDYQGIVDAQLQYRRDPRWRFPSRYYTLQFPLNGGANATFLMIDTSPFIEDYYVHPETPEMAIQLRNQHWQEQLTWLENTLSTIRKDDPTGWIIAVGHQWIYSHDAGTSNDLEKNLLPVLRKYGISTYIAGHEHNLQHISAASGTVPTDYFISGAGGKLAPSREGLKRGLKEGLGSRFHAKKGGYMIVDLHSNLMDVTFYDDEQAAIHKTQVQRPGSF